MQTNLSFVPIEKLLKKKQTNIIFGKLAKGHSLKKNYKFKELEDNLSNNNKVEEFKLMNKFYNRKMNQLVIFFNNLHNLKKDRRFWEIVIGPFLNIIIFVSRDRWLTINSNIKKLSTNNCSTIKFNSAQMTPTDYSDFFNLLSRHEINCFLYFKAYEHLNKKKVNINLKNIKFLRKKKIKLEEPFLYKSIYKLYQNFFSQIRKNQKYLFFNHNFKRRDNIFLNFKLANLPFLYEEFTFEVKKNITQRNLNKYKFYIKSKSQYEKFFDEILFYLMPKTYLENFKALNHYASNLKFNPKIIFTSISHTTNDCFKIWSANKISTGSKLLVSDHGGQLESNINFYFNNIYNHYIRWTVKNNKNMIKLPINIFSNLRKNKYQRNIESEKILVCLTARYFYKKTYLHKKGNDLEHYKFVKNQLLELFSKNTEKIYFRVHPSSEMKNQLNKLIINDFGKDKIDNKNNYLDTIDKYQLIIDTNPETTFLQSLYADVPTILLYDMKFMSIDIKLKNLLKKMENKIIFKNFQKNKKKIVEIIENPHSWWNSKYTTALKNKYLNLCGINDKKYLKKWVKFLDKL